MGSDGGSGGGGYGYGIGWARHHSWFPTVFDTTIYDRWYPVNWVPFYVVPETYVRNWDKNGVVPPPEAYVKNTTVTWPTNLPTLPSFKSEGIFFDEEELNRDILSTAQVGQLKEEIALIDKALQRLNAQHVSFIQQGYRVVPDMDRKKFSWVKVDSPGIATSGTISTNNNNNNV
jgi:hypothetical protein